MKKSLIIGSAAMGLLTGRLSAQLPVVDGAQIEQNWITHLEDLARYTKMIENQVQQITTLSQQLAQLTFVSTVLGNPATNQTLPGIQSVITSINSAAVAMSRPELLLHSTAAIAHFDNGRGLYQPVGESFKTHDGRTQLRTSDSYKPIAAIIQTTTNHDAVYEDVMIRRQALREGLRETVKQLQTATTHAENQKLLGVLISQMAEQAATDHEPDFAAQRALIQDIANRNDRIKQEQANREEQAAEVGIGVRRVTDLLRSITKDVSVTKPK